MISWSVTYHAAYLVIKKSPPSAIDGIDTAENGADMLLVKIHAVDVREEVCPDFG